MDHIAIMNPKLGSIEKILSGEKSIESRWSKNKIAPWNKIHTNDIAYFKYSGQPVIAKANVAKVIQFDHLSSDKFEHIVEKFGRAICLQNTEYDPWYQAKNYVTLIFLKEPHQIEPFQINKSGFGSGCAWLCVNNLEKIRK